MSFRIGQKVVCVDADKHPEWNQYWTGPCAGAPHQWLTKDAIYIVRRVGNRKTPLVWLKGINRRKVETDGYLYLDSGFHAARFRPLVERKTDISIFTEMLKTDRVPALSTAD